VWCDVVVPLLVHCEHCPSTTPALLTVHGFLTREDEAELRAYLRVAHPDIEVWSGLANLLDHLRIEPTPG